MLGCLRDRRFQSSLEIRGHHAVAELQRPQPPLAPVKVVVLRDAATEGVELHHEVAAGERLPRGFEARVRDELLQLRSDHRVGREKRGMKAGLVVEYHAD